MRFISIKDKGVEIINLFNKGQELLNPFQSHLGVKVRRDCSRASHKRGILEGLSLQLKVFLVPSFYEITVCQKDSFFS